MSVVTPQKAWETVMALLLMARQEGATDPAIADSGESWVVIVDQDSGRTWKVEIEEF